MQHGGATLTINGAAVAVRPNGAFLAWVAMPPRSRPQFELVASTPGSAAQRLVLPIRLPAPRLVLDGARPPYLDTTSIAPRGGLALRDAEPVRVAVRLAPGARAEVRPSACAGSPLLPAALPLLLAEGAETAARDLPARALRCGATLAVIGRGDTVPVTRAIAAVADGDSLGLVRVGEVTPDSDAVVIARPVPGGTYKWFLLPGTVLQATGRQGDAVRVRLDAQLEVWVDASAVTPLPGGTVAPRRTVANARLVPATGYVDLVLPMSARPAYRVEAEGRALRLTLHGTTGNTDIAWFQRGDSLVRDMQWTNEATIARCTPCNCSVRCTAGSRSGVAMPSCCASGAPRRSTRRARCGDCGLPSIPDTHRSGPPGPRGFTRQWRRWPSASGCSGC